MFPRCPTAKTQVRNKEQVLNSPFIQRMENDVDILSLRLHIDVSTRLFRKHMEATYHYVDTAEHVHHITLVSDLRVYG